MVHHLWHQYPLNHIISHFNQTFIKTGFYMYNNGCEERSVSQNKSTNDACNHSYHTPHPDVFTFCMCSTQINITAKGALIQKHSQPRSPCMYTSHPTIMEHTLPLVLEAGGTSVQVTKAHCAGPLSHLLQT